MKHRLVYFIGLAGMLLAGFALAQPQVVASEDVAGGEAVSAGGGYVLSGAARQADLPLPIPAVQNTAALRTSA